MKKNLLFYITNSFCVLEGFICFWASIIIPTENKNSLLFGFSLSRLVMLCCIILSLLFLIYLFFNRNRVFNFVGKRFSSEKSFRILTSLGIISFILLWITIFSPAENLFPYEAFFIRLKPSLIWYELILFQFVLWIKVIKNNHSKPSKSFFPDRRLGFLVSLILIAVWVLISATKIGLVKNTAFWNVPGIPITTIQMLGIILFIFIFLIFFSSEQSKPGETSKFFKILIPLLIYLATVVIWGSTPMLKHFFSLNPTLPNLQPYPYSDARIHDLGAISILQGEGIYFHGYTDKPLYMVFLAILHLFSGTNYTLLQSAQILVLALVPVVLFWFGKKYLNELFGIVLASLVILQQRNAIVLSYTIASVNPKLEVTEELMLLGIICATYLFFLWMRNPESKKIFLLGGLIGALSLIRINPVFILPVMILIIIIKFWKFPRVLWRQVLLFTIGFLLVFSPWLITGTNSNGDSWFLLKIQDVVQNRYPAQLMTPQPDEEQFQTLPSTNQSDHQTIPASPQTPSNSVPATNNDPIASLMFNHFLHNFTTTILSLPNSINIDNLADLSTREYWQENNHWNGSFPFGEYLLILVNLSLIGLGIAVSWRNYRWAGLSPLIIFCMYDLSLSAALNSGSRYIVPISWIIFFYYLLGIISICKSILSLAGIKTAEDHNDHGLVESSQIPQTFKSLIPTILILCLAASLIPVANLVLPKFLHPLNIDQQTIQLVILQESKNDQVIAGEILYPYFNEIDNTFDFDFMSGTEILEYSVPSTNMLSSQNMIESETPAIISLSTSSDQHDLTSVYLVDHGIPKLIWRAEEK